jgi:fructose-1,6-bisphosphatase I
MADAMSLEGYLRTATQANSALAEVSETVAALARAGAKIAAAAAISAFEGDRCRSAGVNADGEAQKEFDLRAQDIIVAALRSAPVAAIASEELEDWLLLDAARPLAVAFDPLDGSSNIDANMPIGAIFSILPAKGADNPFVGPHSAQAGAGFFVYGAQTILVLSLGAGVDVFTLDPRDGDWRLTRANVCIPPGVSEFAINSANYRHWEEPVRVFIDECLAGADGPRTTDFNMRWIGALVAEALRVLTRGGIYLYPGDGRDAYRRGRLRLLYEAHPIAFIIEQAGGKASTGRARILDTPAASLHQRTPLIFGGAEYVEHIERLHMSPERRAESPLFGRRGLFRA